MALSPCLMSKPAVSTEGLGRMQTFDVMNFDELPQPERRKLDLAHCSEAMRRFQRVHIHCRRAGRVPSQANISYTFQLDKKKGIMGPLGLRVLHCFARGGGNSTDTCCTTWDVSTNRRIGPTEESKGDEGRH